MICSRKKSPRRDGKRDLCAYCKGPHESSDHSPPKCLLTWPPASGMKVLTIPSCLRCNQESSRQENLVWLMLALVGRHPVLAEYRSVGGKVERAFKQTPSLREAIELSREI